MPREEPLCLGTAAVWSETFASLKKIFFAVSAESFMHVLVFSNSFLQSLTDLSTLCHLSLPAWTTRVILKAELTSASLPSEIRPWWRRIEHFAMPAYGTAEGRRGLRQSADGRGKKTKENHLIKKFKSLVPKCCFKHLTKNTYKYWGKIKHMSYSILCSNIWISLKNQNIEYKKNHNIVQYKQNIVTYDQSISLFFHQKKLHWNLWWSW